MGEGVQPLDLSLWWAFSHHSPSQTSPQAPSFSPFSCQPWEWGLCRNFREGSQEEIKVGAWEGWGARRGWSRDFVG